MPLCACDAFSLQNHSFDFVQFAAAYSSHVDNMNYFTYYHCMGAAGGNTSRTSSNVRADAVAALLDFANIARVYDHHKVKQLILLLMLPVQSLVFTADDSSGPKKPMSLNSG